MKNSSKIGLFIVCCYLLMALAWPLAKYFGFEYLEQNIRHDLLPPLHEGYVLGTDIYGRSIVQVLLEGVSYTVFMSLTVASLSLALGIFLGWVASSKNKFIGRIFELVTNVMFVFPGIIVAILIMSFSGKSFGALVFTLVFTGWPSYARICRGEILRIREQPYIEGAEAIGRTKFLLFFKHILPNVMPVLLVHAIIGLGGVIISEAALSFLGLGGSEYSWGAMLALSRSVLLEGPHLAIIFSLCMSILIISINLLGDGLRDRLDPYQQS